MILIASVCINLITFSILLQNYEKMNSDTEKANEREHSEDKDTGNQLLPSINSNLQEGSTSGVLNPVGSSSGLNWVETNDSSILAENPSYNEEVSSGENIPAKTTHVDVTNSSDGSKNIHVPNEQNVQWELGLHNHDNTYQKSGTQTIELVTTEIEDIQNKSKYEEKEYKQSNDELDDSANISVQLVSSDCHVDSYQSSDDIIKQVCIYFFWSMFTY